jgi:iron-sulfur cluster assembly protein
LIVTLKAQEQLKKVLNFGESLEIGLKGGGCNGLMITLEKIQSTGTTELSIGENTVFADKTTQKYLQGGNLDYEDKGFSQRFVVNPSESTRRCGCGDSIALPSMQ